MSLKKHIKYLWKDTQETKYGGCLGRREMGDTVTGEAKPSTVGPLI